MVGAPGSRRPENTTARAGTERPRYGKFVVRYGKFGAASGNYVPGAPRGTWRARPRSSRPSAAAPSSGGVRCHQPGARGRATPRGPGRGSRRGMSTRSWGPWRRGTDRRTRAPGSRWPSIRRSSAFGRRSSSGPGHGTRRLGSSRGGANPPATQARGSERCGTTPNRTRRRFRPPAPASRGAGRERQRERRRRSGSEPCRQRWRWCRSYPQPLQHPCPALTAAPPLREPLDIAQSARQSCAPTPKNAQSFRVAQVRGIRRARRTKPGSPD